MTLRTTHRTLLALLVAHLFLSVTYSIWNPLAEAPDEADHFAVVRYLAAERNLPSGPTVTQSKHPPLYHITAALVASLGDPLDYQFLRANPDLNIQPVRNWSPNFFIHTTLEDWPWQKGPLAFHLARLWSVLLSTLTVLATYAIARTGFPDRPGLALAAAGVLAFVPEFAFIGGSVNNDNGAALFGALILWGALAFYRSGGRWQAAWWTPFAMGLGLLTKVSTAALWPVVLLAVIMGVARPAVVGSDIRAWRRGVIISWSRWATTCTLVLIIALAVASPWLMRNWRLYGDPLGQGLTVQTIDQRATAWTLADTVWLVRGWFVSFWGKFGGAGHIPMPAWTYWLLAVASIVALAGLAREWTGSDSRNRPIILLLILAAASTAVAIWWYSLTALGTDQGRLLYPALSAIVSLFVLGLANITPVRWQPSCAIAGIIALAVLGVYGLAGVIRPAFSPPPPSDLALLPGGSIDAPVQFGPLSLVVWQASEDAALYWYTPEQPDADWRTALRIVAEDGSLVWEWRRSPGYGRWSTDHWPAGAVLRDEYAVDWPDWAGPGRYRVEVGAHAHGAELAIPTVNGEPGAAPQHPYYFLGWIERP